MVEVTYRLEIRGRVQGWVRNRLDGSVEAVVQGGAHEVNRMVEWARRGPPNAVVASLDIFPYEGDFVGFHQREST